MPIDAIKTVGVVGAGTMGQGIAQVSAMAGYACLLFDIDPEATEKALAKIAQNLDKGIERGKVTEELKEKALANIQLHSNLDDVKADLIIEAIVEKLEIKQELFSKLEEVNDKGTILASNTSSIPITQIAASLNHPERFLGLHFFNPAHIMKLVEVISGAATSEDTASVAKAFAEKIGKVAVLANDAPGFIVNRVARHYYVESLLLLEENVASHEQIDQLLESTGFKMGPFKLMDLIGVDTNYSVTESMYGLFNYDSKFRPSRIQKQKVDAGHHGRKSGRGFYQY